MSKGFQTCIGLIVICAIIYFLYPILLPQPPKEQVVFALESYRQKPQMDGNGYVMGRFKFSNTTNQPVYVVYNCSATDQNGVKYFATAVTKYPLGMGDGYYEDDFLFWYHPNFPGQLPSYEAVRSVTLDGFTYSFHNPLSNPSY